MRRIPPSLIRERARTERSEPTDKRWRRPSTPSLVVPPLRRRRTSTTFDRGNRDNRRADRCESAPESRRWRAEGSLLLVGRHLPRSLGPRLAPAGWKRPLDNRRADRCESAPESRRWRAEGSLLLVGRHLPRSLGPRLAPAGWNRPHLIPWRELYRLPRRSFLTSRVGTGKPANRKLAARETDQ